MSSHWSRAIGAFGIVTALSVSVLCARADDPAAAKPADPAQSISYDKQVRPIFQAHCQGCHQPAKAGGKYVMTDFPRLVKGGETGVAAVVPGKPAESHLLEQITPQDGKAKMPQGKSPLTPAEIDVVSRWIAQGAKDDTPANAVSRYDVDHPPVYTRPPVITAIDFSPDGQLLAVAGFHEVLLWKADGSEQLARLIGLAERIESVRFSPDGSKLAVTGGLPGRTGEVQIWDVAKRKLALSVPVTADTIYGASWSPDGKTVAFGAPDNTVRAIDASNGAQTLFMGSHNDWPLDTVFSKDGGHLISVSRDMTVKLTEVPTQRFVDNITSITPGALKGGVSTVTRHPTRNEILFGGSDGVPKVYRIFRETPRQIGDDANKIAELTPMLGRVYGVAYSADGHKLVACSAIDGKGQIDAYAYAFDENKADDTVKAILKKEPMSRSPEERSKLDGLQRDSLKRLSSVAVPQGAVYTVAIRPDGGAIVAAGGDGIVRLIDPDNGAIVKEFAPAPVGGAPAPSPAIAVADLAAAGTPAESAAKAESLPQGATLAALEIQPPKIELVNRFDYVQVVVTGKLSSGDSLDVTRMATLSLSAPIAEISPGGMITPKADGKAVLKLALNDKTVDVPVEVRGFAEPYAVDFVRDVNPILSRVGCNQGTCHGSAQGKNGFKLSLRGYDPIFDVRALTDDLASRRVNLASPDDSLMLLKATGAVPHVGGRVYKPGEAYYDIIRGWIADGAKLKLDTPRVAKLDVFPINPVIQADTGRQQLRVVATYADGRVKDVTREAFLESGNTEVAKPETAVPGLMNALRRGEAPVLVRFEGAYAATTLTVMGDRTGFAWQAPPTYGRIDELTADKWRRMKIKPSDVCGDAEFIRRVTLDLTGLPPTPEAVRAFLADGTESRVKREKLVDSLIGNKEYVEFWTNKWADLLQVNRKFLGVEGAVAFRKWIRDQVERNVPYDQIARSIITASGSNKDNPAASYFKILRDPAPIMENTTQLFLGVRFNCNKCHDHPFERWTQDQYYETAAFFARVGLEKDPASGDRQIGGTAVESGKPLFEKVTDKGDGEVKHDRTGSVTPPKFPFDAKHESPKDAARRQELASWLTSPDNPYFARSYVNRLWGYLLGTGIIEPLDDIRAGNPPSNPELLDHLTNEFIKSGFDSRHVVRLIVKSRTYQLAVSTDKWNDDDKINYSHAMARRLPAEVLYDSVYRVTGAVSNIPGVAPGTRAAELPDSEVELPSGFFTTFGRPARESACECERSSGLQLGPVMALVSGPTVGDAIADPNNELTKLVAREADDAKLIDEMFVRILNRPAGPGEIELARQSFREIEADHQKLTAEVATRQSEVDAERPKREKDRLDAIAAAKKAVEDREKLITPEVAEREKKRNEAIAARQAELSAYEAGLPAKLAAWEKAQSLAVHWAALDPKTLQASNAATLTKEADGSIIVTGGSDDNGRIIITAETELKDITGLRIEAIADPRLPNRGPGRAQDGNFVLSELQVTAAPKADPSKVKPVAFQGPKADFTQAGFDPAHLIDGNLSGNNGWALSPLTGMTHWAVLETKENVGFDGGTVLTVTLVHNFGKPFMPGRFRISLTKQARPVPLDIAEEYRSLIALAPEVRTAAQNETLMKYFRALDNELKQKQTALAEAQKPLEPDATLVRLRSSLAEVEKPLAEDARLVRLKKDAEASAAQLAARRLTAAQDLAWALINSPAFLFNH